VVIPDPVACFAGATYEQRTTIRLAGDASLVFLDALTCGRSARGERWAFTRYASRTRIEREGRLVAHDAVVLDAQRGGPLPERMGRFEALATIISIGAAAPL